MIDKREIKRFSLKFGKFLDPLALFLLLAVFILPALAVINLSPKSQARTNVLGTKSKQDISVVLVGGTHPTVVNEKLSFPSDDRSEYSSTISKHEAGTYSKPIVQITNSYNKSAKIDFYGQTENTTNSEIFLIVNEKEYLLQEKNGNTYPISLEVSEQTKSVVYLKIVSDIPQLFSEKFNLTIVQK